MWKLNQEPWQKWLLTKCFFDGEGGGGDGGSGEGGEGGGAPTGGEPAAGSTGGGEPTGGAPAAPGGTPAAVPAVPRTPGAPAPVDQATMWREQADYMRGELQRTTAALQQVLKQQQGGGAPKVGTGTVPTPQDLFNIDEKELANLHPAVQAMFRAMKELHENVGGIKTQFDQTTQASAAAQEAQQAKEIETALNTYIDTTLEGVGLRKGGTLTSIVNRVALQSLKTLHSQGYAITRNVIDSVVGDLVTSIKQDMTPKQPANLPPKPPAGGGGNPQLPAVPTAADRKAALTAAISSMNMED